MKHTIESATRKVKRGYGIGAYGARDFLRAKGIKDIDVNRAARPLDPVEGWRRQLSDLGERAHVIITQNDPRCLKHAH